MAATLGKEDALKKQGKARLTILPPTGPLQFLNLKDEDQSKTCGLRRVALMPFFFFFEDRHGHHGKTKSVVRIKDSWIGYQLKDEIH